VPGRRRELGGRGTWLGSGGGLVCGWHDGRVGVQGSLGFVLVAFEFVALPLTSGVRCFHFQPFSTCTLCCLLGLGGA